MGIKRAIVKEDDKATYNEGCNARYYGTSRAECPYPPGSKDAASWLQGWKDCGGVFLSNKRGVKKGASELAAKIARETGVSAATILANAAKVAGRLGMTVVHLLTSLAWPATATGSTDWSLFPEIWEDIVGKSSKRFSKVFMHLDGQWTWATIDKQAKKIAKLHGTYTVDVAGTIYNRTWVVLDPVGNQVGPEYKTEAQANKKARELIAARGKSLVPSAPPGGWKSAAGQEHEWNSKTRKWARVWVKAPEDFKVGAKVEVINGPGTGTVGTITNITNGGEKATVKDQNGDTASFPLVELRVIGKGLRAGVRKYDKSASWSEGCTANGHGYALSSCPYGPGSKDAKEWTDGWKECSTKTLKKLKQGDRVKIKPRGGMREFFGKTGTIVGEENMGRDRYFRVELDEPVQVEGVGEVTDDIWMAPFLQKI